MLTPAVGRRHSGLVLIALAFLFGSLLIARSARAAPQALVIRSVTITNVTDTSFSVNWVTDQPLSGSGSISYGTSPTGPNLQAREPAGSVQGVHSVSLTSLNSDTTYYFSILVGGVTYPGAGYAYRAATGPTLPPSSTPRRASGKVAQSNGSPAAGVLVTIRVLDNVNLNGPSPTTSAPLSTVADASGIWSVSLVPRTADNSNYFSYSTTNGVDYLQVTVEGGLLGVAYPPVSTAISPDSSGTIQSLQVTLGQGVLPAETPVAAQATATATPTPTITATETRGPLATPTARGPALTPTSTPSPYLIPTVAPVSTRVEPPQNLPPREIPTATPVGANLSEPPPAVPTPIVARTPSHVPAPGLAPTPTALGASAALPSPQRALRRSPTPSTTATSTPLPPTPIVLEGGGSSGASGPLQSLTVIVTGAVGLIGLGLAVSVVGVVNQRRDG